MLYSDEMINVQVLTTKWFARFARREKITDAMLCEAVARAQKGIVDADLGGNVLKQRIARKGEGRSGGYRTILLFRIGERAIFAYGFAKNAQDNIDKAELEAFRSLAAELMEYDEGRISKALDAGALLEVTCNGDE